MSNKSNIPPLLHPYLSLPSEQALILLTGVLGAGTNWLVLRALAGVLSGGNTGYGGGEGGNWGGEEGNRGDEEGGKVVLVSFLRDVRAWGEGGRRVGLDLDKLSREKRFAFIDGLLGLFLPNIPAGKLTTPAQGTELPDRVLKSPLLSKISDEISTAIKSLGEGKVVLVIDGLDALLAASGDGVSVGDVEDMVMELREQVYATIMALSADAPLINSQQTPLETNHAALVLGMAHQADYIMSLRLLDTGTARDVSGVVRITLGEEADVEGRQLEEKELLYFVGGDGAVKVFERGQ